MGHLACACSDSVLTSARSCRQRAVWFMRWFRLDDGEDRSGAREWKVLALLLRQCLDQNGARPLLASGSVLAEMGGRGSCTSTSMATLSGKRHKVSATHSASPCLRQPDLMYPRSNASIALVTSSETKVSMVAIVSGGSCQACNAAVACCRAQGTAAVSGANCRYEMSW